VGEEDQADSDDDEEEYELVEEQKSGRDSVRQSLRRLCRGMLDHIAKKQRGYDARSVVMDSERCVALDAAITREHLQPRGKDVRQALSEFEHTIANRQRDNSTRGYWAGLR